MWSESLNKFFNFNEPFDVEETRERYDENQRHQCVSKGDGSRRCLL